MPKCVICPSCGAKGFKVIYLGLPMKLCSDESCSCLWGFFSSAAFLSHNGFFLPYEGSYLIALYHWLFDKFE